MQDLQGYEEGGSCQYDQPQDDGLGGSGAHIGDDDFKIGYGRREKFENSSDKAREINAE